MAGTGEFEGQVEQRLQLDGGQASTDGWEWKRDESGNILPDPNFPDMKALADYVHSKGLKAPARDILQTGPTMFQLHVELFEPAVYKEPNTVFVNLGNGTFADVSADAALYGRVAKATISQWCSGRSHGLRLRWWPPFSHVASPASESPLRPFVLRTWSRSQVSTLFCTTAPRPRST